LLDNREKPESPAGTNKVEKRIKMSSNKIDPMLEGLEPIVAVINETVTQYEDLKSLTSTVS
jgi:hypothetical protein